jgi:hypothetical protein
MGRQDESEEEAMSVYRVAVLQVAYGCISGLSRAVEHIAAGVSGALGTLAGDVQVRANVIHRAVAEARAKASACTCLECQRQRVTEEFRRATGGGPPPLARAEGIKLMGLGEELAEWAVVHVARALLRAGEVFTLLGTALLVVVLDARGEFA